MPDCKFLKMKFFKTSALVLLLTVMAFALNDGSYTLFGNINNRYGFQMDINVQGQNVYGSYKYDSENARLSLNGSINSQGYATLYETDPKGKRTGVFRGMITTQDGLLNFNGNWSTPDGRTVYNFSCSEPGC